MKKMRVRSRAVMLFAIMMLTGLMLAGCSENEPKTPAASETPAESPMATATPEVDVPVTEVKFLLWGNKPTGFEDILMQVNDKMKKDKTGASLSIQWVPQADFVNALNVKLAAGEDLDGYFNAPWMNMNLLISQNQALPLDDLLPQYPELLKSIPQQMWEANKFNGKIFGIPLGITQGQFRGFLIRKDLREKYGLPPIKTLGDLENFLYTVKEKEKDIHPYAWVANGVDLERFDPIQYTNGKKPFYRLSMKPGFKVSDVDNKIILDKVFGGSGFSAQSDESTVKTMELYKKIHKFYTDGIIDKDVLTQKPANIKALFKQGMYAAIGIDSNGLATSNYLPELLKNVPGAQLEAVYPYEVASPKPYSDFKQDNFILINKASKKADKVMAIMNWLSIRENHDLLQYGIEGKHYKAVGEDEYEIINPGYSFPGYEISWRPNLERTVTTMLPEEKSWYNRSKDANNFAPAPSTGFTFDPTNVKTEVAQVTSLSANANVLQGGVVEPVAFLEEYNNKQKDAGYLKIAEEVQKQLAAFLAAKK